MHKLLTAFVLAACTVPAAASASPDADAVRGHSREAVLRNIERHVPGDRAPLLRARLRAERQRLLALPDDRAFAAELEALLCALTGDPRVAVSSGA